jgi:hypothetical protein
MIKDLLLLLIVLVNNLFLIILVFSLLPKRVRNNFPQKPRVKLPKVLKKTKKEDYNFLEEIPVDELNKTLFKK